MSKRLLKQKKFRKLLGSFLILSVVLGLVIVQVEKDAPGTLIKNNFDGLYWAVSTITTVGYGDVVPVTPIGRIIAMVLELVGTFMFAMIIAVISLYLDKNQDEFYWGRTFDRISQLEEKLDSLKKNSDFIVKKEEDEE